MSGQPPNPYPYQGYPPPPPPPGSVAFLPTPVMLPMYPPPPHHHEHAPSQPTIINNHIYPHPPSSTTEPPHFVDSPPDDVQWIGTTSMTASTLSEMAFIGGKEGWDGSPLWVIRAHFSGDLIPGKLAIKHRSAYIGHGEREIPVHNFEVLCCPAYLLRWVPASRGEVPVGAVAGGSTHTGETLYVARARQERSITPGKLHPSHSRCYIPFSGREIAHKYYEVLCKINP